MTTKGNIRFADLLSVVIFIQNVKMIKGKIGGDFVFWKI